MLPLKKYLQNKIFSVNMRSSGRNGAACVISHAGQRLEILLSLRCSDKKEYFDLRRFNWKI